MCAHLPPLQFWVLNLFSFSWCLISSLIAWILLVRLKNGLYSCVYQNPKPSASSGKCLLAPLLFCSPSSETFCLFVFGETDNLIYLWLSLCSSNPVKFEIWLKQQCSLLWACRLHVPAVHMYSGKEAQIVLDPGGQAACPLLLRGGYRWAGCHTPVYDTEGWSTWSILLSLRMEIEQVSY